MTVGVCLKCGAMKVGAWSQCHKCNYDPVSPEDRAKHVMASSHYMTKEQLNQISERVKAGHELNFNDEQVNSYRKGFRKLGH